MLRVLAAAALVAGLLFSGTSAAQPTDDATRAAARKLGYAGIEAYEAGDFRGAAEKLDKAYRVLHAPSLGLWCARAYVKTGRMVEASERYLEVTRLAVSSGDVAVQEKAKEDAEREHQELAPRIPNLVVKLQGATPEEVSVSVDGKPVARELIGEEIPVDPGDHLIEGSRGGERHESRVTAQEANEHIVVLGFDPTRRAAPVAQNPEPGSPQQKAAPAETHDGGAPESKPGSTQRTLGWMSIGLGGAALIAGSITGYLTIQKEKEVEGSGDCTGGCKDTGRYKNFKTLRTVTVVNLVAAGVFGATGVVLLVTAPSGSSSGVALGIGPGSVRLSGSF